MTIWELYNENTFIDFLYEDDARKYMQDYSWFEIRQKIKEVVIEEEVNNDIIE